MNTIQRILLALSLGFSLVACGERDEAQHADEPGDEHGHEEAEEEFARGPHGGRLLSKDPYTVELAIVEDGIPPEFHAWLYRDGKPLPPANGRLRVTLARLGGKNDVHEFAPRGDALVGNAVVYEPHSFDVTVDATIDGKPLRWTYESPEGRVEIDAETARESGIRTARVGAGAIRDEHEVQGILTLVEGKHASVVARFPGPVTRVAVGVGDRVTKGATLAVVESNASLSNYTIASPLAGTVLAANVAAGDLASDTPLFEIADLSSLWVDLHVFGADAEHLAAGQPVQVRRLSDGKTIETVIDRILPSTATESQSTVARATVDNADGRWRPGAAVSARVTVSTANAALVIPLAALQAFRDWTVAFIRVGDTYEIRPLTLGRRDATNVEVLEGLNAGDEIVVEQSFLIKADIEKSGASHDH